MGKLVELGYADRAAVEQTLMPGMEYNYSRNQQPIALAIQQGTFF